MHRSSSTGRASSEFKVNSPPNVKASQSLKIVNDDELLPLHSSTSNDTKKEAASHLKSAGDNVVHLVPLIVIISWVILFLCSSSADVMQKPESTVESVGGLNINGHSSQIGVPSFTKLKDFEKLEHLKDKNPGKKFK